VVGDWNAQEQIPGCTKYRCAAAILAGVDMLMAPDSWRELYKNTLAQAQVGGDSAGAHRRCGAAHPCGSSHGGTVQARAPSSGTRGAFRSSAAAHRALAREAVRKSLVLLKNDHGTLALGSARHVWWPAPRPTIGCRAAAGPSIGRAITTATRIFPGATSIFGGIKGRGGGGRRFGGAESKDGRFRTSRMPPSWCSARPLMRNSEGDRETLEFSPERQARPRTVAALATPRACPPSRCFCPGAAVGEPEINASDAFVAAWLPGSEGEGVADLLFRASDGSVLYDFAGKLSFSWPATGMPVRYEAAGKVSGALFPLGYGLTLAQAATRLPRLSERAEVPADRHVDGTLIHAAHVTAPWSLFVSDRSAEVRLTTQRQESPLGVLSVTRDRAGAVARWSADQPGIFRISGRPADYRAEAAAGRRIVARYQILTKPTNPVRIGVRCAAPTMRLPAGAPAAAPAVPDPALCNTAGGAMLDLTAALRLAPLGAWRTLSIPLSCLSSRGADLANVEAPFAIETAGQFRIAIADVRIEHRGAREACDGRP
jgi:beta-glucosidase